MKGLADEFNMPERLVQQKWLKELDFKLSMSNSKKFKSVETYFLSRK